MRPVVVGIDPGRDAGRPLDPAFPSGRRLAELAGLSPGDFLGRLDRVNLYPSASGGLDPAVCRSTDPAAGDNLRPLLRGSRVVALGRRVARALGADEDPFRWSPGSSVLSWMPHPSGLNRWWNRPENEASARDFLSRLLLPCVHVEGADGSGKTTLARRLAGRLGRSLLVPTDGPPGDWEECLERIGARVAPGLVCDRSSGLVSELVYGPVLRGATVVSEEQVWDYLRGVARAVTFVYCRPPESALAPSFREEEDPVHVRGVTENLGRLVRRYDEVMDRIVREGGTVVRYDRTRQTPEEVLRCVE